MATPSQKPQSYTTQTIELTLPPQDKTTAHTQRPWSYWADPHIRTYLEASQSNTQPSARETAKLWAQILGRALVFPCSSSSSSSSSDSDSQAQNYRLLTRRFIESATQNPLLYEIIDLVSPVPQNGQDSIVIQIICHDATTAQASPELQLREIRQRKLALLQQQLVAADSALLPEFVLGVAVGGHVWFQNLQGEDGCRRGLCKVLCLVQDRGRVEEWLRSLRRTLGVVNESEGSFFDEDSESEDENGCCENCGLTMA
ncbi:uncharacterized protein BO95DRAFT_469388 [Aspergillus brunneoviolaceus CBS 621.78]|uniref:Uncharacterized protein n=1 Tax=Aspergillus brunneoviolaceus CBS 621.78 TaxID=1450534 RepID=A0ACD1FS62_9EURO|nr:hypothetical protein BO95DRAFT_469388 [Aspergillus brunneoviolaceus CBS 621.78]RAH39830.1 hypothetical protein BO95DRAFT_469388 [Aspergillus brunneoviolaceus CBS 621.78]